MQWEALAPGRGQLRRELELLSRVYAAGRGLAADATVAEEMRRILEADGALRLRLESEEGRERAHELCDDGGRDAMVGDVEEADVYERVPEIVQELWERAGVICLREIDYWDGVE